MSIDGIIYFSGDIVCNGILKLSLKIAHTIGCVTDESIAAAILYKDPHAFVVPNYFLGLCFLFLLSSAIWYQRKNLLPMIVVFSIAFFYSYKSGGLQHLLAGY